MREVLSLYQFNALDVSSRGTYLWEHGQFLSNGGDDSGLFAFYSLHDYFVEVIFDLEFNTIVSLVPFKAGPRYERLLDVLRIPNLLNS